MLMMMSTPWPNRITIFFFFLISNRITKNYGWNRNDSVKSISVAICKTPHKGPIKWHMNKQCFQDPTDPYDPLMHAIYIYL